MRISNHNLLPSHLANGKRLLPTCPLRLSKLTAREALTDGDHLQGVTRHHYAYLARWHQFSLASPGIKGIKKAKGAVGPTCGNPPKRSLKDAAEEATIPPNVGIVTGDLPRRCFDALTAVSTGGTSGASSYIHPDLWSLSLESWSAGKVEKWSVRPLEATQALETLSGWSISDSHSSQYEDSITSTIKGERSDSLMSKRRS
jgi:hypothetical protein